MKQQGQPKGQEYRSYRIVQGDGHKTGNKRIEVFDPQGNYLTSFAYPAMNLLERKKRITKAMEYVDKILNIH